MALLGTASEAVVPKFTTCQPWPIGQEGHSCATQKGPKPRPRKGRPLPAPPSVAFTVPPRPEEPVRPIVIGPQPTHAVGQIEAVSRAILSPEAPVPVDWACW